MASTPPSLMAHPMGVLYRNLPGKCIKEFTFKCDIFYLDEMNIEQLMELRKNGMDFSPEPYYCNDTYVDRKVELYVNLMETVCERLHSVECGQIAVDRLIANLRGCLYMYKQTVMAFTEAWILSCQTKSPLDSHKLIRTLLWIFNAISASLVVVKEVVIVDECGVTNQQDVTFEFSIIYNFVSPLNILLRYKIFIENTYQYVLPIVNKITSEPEFFNNVQLIYCKHVTNELLRIYQFFSPTTRQLNPHSPCELEQILTIIERFLLYYNQREPEQLENELFLNLKSINAKYLEMFFQYMELENCIQFQIVYIEHLRKILCKLIISLDYIFRFEIFKCLSSYIQCWKHIPCPSSYVWFCKFIDIFNEIIDRFIRHDSRKICKISFFIISAISNVPSNEIDSFMDKFAEILPNVKRSFDNLNDYEPIDYFRYYALNDPDVLNNPLKYQIMHDLLM